MTQNRCCLLSDASLESLARDITTWNPTAARTWAPFASTKTTAKPDRDKESTIMSANGDLDEDEIEDYALFTATNTELVYMDAHHDCSTETEENRVRYEAYSTIMESSIELKEASHQQSVLMDSKNSYELIHMSRLPIELPRQKLLKKTKSTRLLETLRRSIQKLSVTRPERQRESRLSPPCS
eukprot:CFRG0115T1